MYQHLFLLFGIVTLVVSFPVLACCLIALGNPERKPGMMSVSSSLTWVLVLEAILAGGFFICHGVHFILTKSPDMSGPPDFTAMMESPGEPLWWFRSLTYLIPLCFCFPENRRSPLRGVVISILTIAPRLLFFVLFAAGHEASC